MKIIASSLIRSAINLYLFFYVSDRVGHPQLPAVLQYRGHVRPRRRASTPEPRPWLKQST